MSADQVHAAALIVSAFTALVAVMWAIYAGPEFWDRREAAKRARSIFPQDRTWAYTPDHDADEPDPESFDRHAEDAVRLVREWHR